MEQQKWNKENHIKREYKSYDNVFTSVDWTEIRLRRLKWHVEMNSPLSLITEAFGGCSKFEIDKGVKLLNANLLTRAAKDNNTKSFYASTTEFYSTVIQNSRFNIKAHMDYINEPTVY
jgi:hypothetical protein